MHALIVEDEFLLALDLRDLLQELGFTSFAFAIDEAQAVAAAGQRRPSLILADYRLARGTGLGAVRAIRRSCGTVAVVYVTGNPEQLDGEADPVVAKPLTREHLHTACIAALGPRDQAACHDGVPVRP
jgi:CheY-like chemotaxis protein